MNAGRVLFLLAVIVFVLAAFGVKVGPLDMTLVGLALLAAGHLV